MWLEIWRTSRQDNFARCFNWIQLGVNHELKSCSFERRFATLENNFWYLIAFSGSTNQDHIVMIPYRCIGKEEEIRPIFIRNVVPRGCIRPVSGASIHYMLRIEDTNIVSVSLEQGWVDIWRHPWAEASRTGSWFMAPPAFMKLRTQGVSAPENVLSKLTCIGPLRPWMVLLYPEGWVKPGNAEFSSTLTFSAFIM